jgi:integrase
MSGTFKRCACVDPGTGLQLGPSCPRLRGSKHGSWFYAMRLDTTAGRRNLRRGGAATQAEAAARMRHVEQLVALADDDHMRREIGDLVWSSTARGGLVPDVETVRQRVGAGRKLDRVETTGEWLADWLKGKRALRATTARSYEAHVRLYLAPLLGAVPLERLRPSHIEDALDAITAGNPDRERPVGPATLRRIHATLRSALNAAVKQRRLPYNPALHVELPDAPRPKAQPWEAAELGAFLDAAAGDRLGALYELMALSGLRRGEAIGLRWQDVDVERRVITVVQQIVQLGHRTLVAPPKTRSGEHRKVDLDSGTIGSLLDHRLRQDAERTRWGEACVDSGLVFTREDGSALHPEYVTRHMQRIAAAAGLPRRRLHDLRHGSASLQLAAGVPLEIVSKRLGHSAIAITADTYQHLLEGVGRQAAEASAALVPRSPVHVHRDPIRYPSGSEDDDAVPPVQAKPQVRRGAPPGTRTPNPRIKSPLLCQLS